MVSAALPEGTSLSFCLQPAGAQDDMYAASLGHLDAHKDNGISPHGEVGLEHACLAAYGVIFARTSWHGLAV